MKKTNKPIKDLVFRCIPEIWKKEESGLKPNTFRKLSTDDERYVYRNKAENIVVVNTATNETFRRKITDVTEWDGYIIFSWNPNEKQTKTNK